MPRRSYNSPPCSKLISIGLVLTSLSIGCAFPADTAAGNARSTNSTPVAVPFQIRRGHIMLPARVTNSAPLSLMLDSGYSMTMLHPDHIANFALRRTGRVTIVGIAGEAPADVYEGPEFDFAGITWKPRRIAAFNDGGGGRSRRRDGILGSGFFRRFVVDIDSRRNEVRLHEPSAFHYQGPGEVLPLTFSGDTPVVDATVRLPGEKEIKGRFEIDTGCDSALCLGNHFVAEHQLAPTNSAGAGGNRFGVGGSTRTKMTHLPQIQLGQLTVARPSANLFLEGSPVDAPYAGHVGWELLQRFRVVFDYPNKRLILERPPE